MSELEREDIPSSPRPRVPRAVAAIVMAAIAGASLIALLWPSLTEDRGRSTGPTRVNVITEQVDTPEGAGRIGSPAPRFSWIDPQGGRHELADLRGQVVVINFWATWCIPCREEMPALERVARSERDVVILAVDLNEDGERIRNFFDQLGLETLEPLLDLDLRTARRYGVATLPTTFFVGPDGIVRHVEIGGPMSDADIREGIARAR